MGERTSQPLAEKFGRYTLVRSLGSGGMAAAFLATLPRADGGEQKVCVKRIHAGYSHDPSFKQMFLLETEITGQLQNSHVVRLLDAGSVGDVLYMATELVEGSDLRQLIRNLKHQDRVLSPGIVCQLGVDIASAMAHAHTLRGPDGRLLNIIHRDISPGNVLIGEDGVCKLTDFGIAKATALTSHALTKEDGLKGKVSYAAPEQVRSSRDLDARVDIFAFGVMLYEALIGVRPFDPEGENEWMTITRIQNGEHRPAHELAPHAPKALLDIIEKCIRTKREERFSSAREILMAFDAVTPPATARLALGQIVHYFYRSERAAQDPRDEPLSGPIPSGLDEILKLPKIHPHYTFDEKRAVFPSRNPDTNVLASDTQLAAVEAVGKSIPSDDGPTDRVSAPVAPDTRSGTKYRMPIEDRLSGRDATPAKRKKRGPKVWPFALGAAVLLAGIVIGGALVHRLGPGADPVDPSENRPQPAQANPTKNRGARSQTPLPAPAPLEQAPISMPVADAGIDGPASAATSAQTPNPVTRPAPTHAVLRIIAAPYGDIYVDGRKVGEKRIRIVVGPGRHTVGVGPGGTRSVQTIDVRAGDSRSLNLSAR